MWSGSLTFSSNLYNFGWRNELWGVIELKEGGLRLRIDWILSYKPFPCTRGRELMRTRDFCRGSSGLRGPHLLDDQRAEKELERSRKELHFGFSHLDASLCFLMNPDPSACVDFSSERTKFDCDREKLSPFSSQ